MIRRVISMASYEHRVLPSNRAWYPLNLVRVLLSAKPSVFVLLVNAQIEADLARRRSPSTIEMALRDDYQLVVRRLRDDNIHIYVHEQQERRESNGESTRQCVLLDRMTRVRSTVGLRLRGDLASDHSCVGAFVVLAHVQIIFRSQWSAELFFEFVLDLAKKDAFECSSSAAER